MADTHYTCEICGNIYEPTKKKDGTPRNVKHKVCSSACRCLKKARLSGVKPWEEYNEARKKPAHYFKCIYCGIESHRKLGGYNKKHGYENKYCSKQCALDHVKKLRAENANSQEIEAVRLLKARKELLTALRKRLRIIHAEQKKIEKANRPCKRCNEPIGYGFTTGKLFCDACSKERADENRKQYRKYYRKTEKHKESKRASKHLRRALERGVDCEKFNPIEIFIRDGWRCQICGVSTPQSRRGKFYHNSPELDHVVPLAKGGTHTRINVQCACRACNGIKSDKLIVGQMGLFAV